MSVQLQVIPDAWTGLPPFVPGERDVWTITDRGDVVQVRLRAGEMIVPMVKAAELMARASAQLAASAEELRRLIWLGLIDHEGSPVPANPARITPRYALGGPVVQ